MHILWRWLISTGVIMATAYLVSGIDVRSLYTGFMVALILGLINSVGRPLLIIMTFPLTIVSLGLFIIIINAFLLWLTSWIVPGFSIASFTDALIATVVISIFSWFTNMILDPKMKTQ